MRILFINDRMNEVTRQWQLSGCAAKHTLLPFEPFVSVKKTREAVERQQPNVIIIGHGLGRPGTTDVDVVRVLRESGDEVELDGLANRNPEALQSVLNNLTERKAV